LNVDQFDPSRPRRPAFISALRYSTYHCGKNEFQAAFAVIDFPAYWFVCPPRHLNRRIVKRFSDWLGEACEEHQAQARGFLQDLGCTFRRETGPDLEAAAP
jgi:hypothetical protein